MSLSRRTLLKSLAGLAVLPLLPWRRKAEVPPPATPKFPWYGGAVSWNVSRSYYEGVEWTYSDFGTATAKVFVASPEST